MSTTNADQSLAAGRISDDLRIRGEGDGSPRILFLGNSITLHLPAPELGWHGDWGMAASAPELDYVHLCMRRIRARYPQASWRVGQLVAWEQAFWKDEAVLGDFACLSEWRPEYIFSVMLGANTPESALAEHDYAEHYRRMLRFFARHGSPRIIVTDMYWSNARENAAVRTAASQMNAVVVHVGDLSRTPELTAQNLFAHHGVAAHPGDQGMQAIADRLLAAAGLDERAR